MEAKNLASATEKLYYIDSHLKEFTAKVLSCEPFSRGKWQGYRVVLDRTAFFPEGGGQFGDRGWLDGIEVCDTHEKDGVICHETAEPLTVGQTVKGELDYEERFARMQQHTGEHIISGIVHRLFGYDNVGFHLGAELTTLDFNGELTPEQVLEAETEANRTVFANLPVDVYFPEKDELKDMDYRSKIEIEGQVRIVSIPGVDQCACCAPHVSFTGEIGLIKILSCDRHRGGCRMVMVSGARALADYRQKLRSVEEVSVELSAKPEQIGEAVRRAKERQTRLKEHLNRMQAACLEQRLLEIGPEDKNVCIFEEEMDNIAMRNFVNKAMERCPGVCAAFVGNDTEGYHYILGSRSVDMRAFSGELNAEFGGKGGGKPQMVQGSLSCGTKAEIMKMIEEA